MKKGERGGLVLVVFAVFVLLFVMNNVSAATISYADNGDNTGIITISPANGETIYSYEFTMYAPNGASFDVPQNFFEGIGDATYGSSTNGDFITFYGSMLDDTGAGVTTEKEIAVSYTGAPELYSSLFVINEAPIGDSPGREGEEQNEFYISFCNNSIIETPSENPEECDDGNSINGDGCSSTCNVETGWACVGEPSSCQQSCGNNNVDPGETCQNCPSDVACNLNNNTTPGPGGGGGGAIVLNGSVVKISILDALTFNLIIGESKKKSIEISNDGQVAVVLNFSLIGMPKGTSISPNGFSLAPGEKKSFDLSFDDVKAGLIVGSLDVYVSGTLYKSVPIIANIKSGNFIFDVKTDLINKFILFGHKLRAQISLDRIGNKKEEVNLTVYYVIKSFTGNTILEEKDSFSVGNGKVYDVDIPTENLPYGKYVFGLEVVYPGAFASSSAEFSVVSKKPSNYFVLGIVVVLLIAVIIVSLMVNARKKKIKKIVR